MKSVVRTGINLVQGIFLLFVVGCNPLNRAGNVVTGAVEGIVRSLSQFGQAIGNIMKGIPHP